MKRTLLFALLAMLLVPLTLQAKKRKKQAAADSTAIWIQQHRWTAAANDYLFHEGTAVVEGQLTGYDERMPASIVFSLKDLVLNRNDNQVLHVASNATVSGTLRLPHSQACYVEGLGEQIYVGVGDTLRFIYDASKPDGERLTFQGSSTTADVNRHWPALYKQYYKDLPRAWNSNLSTPDALYAFIATYEHLADSCMRLVARGGLPTDVTPLARDILGYGLINEALTCVLDAQMYYSDKRYLSGTDSVSGQRYVKPNPDYVEMDSLRANRLLVRYENVILQSPLMLCSPQTWVTVNRMRFNQYYMLSHYKYTYPVCSGENVQPSEAARELLKTEDWRRFYTLPRHYHHDVDHYIEQLTQRPGYSLAQYWQDAIAQANKQTGLSPNLMCQLSLCQKLSYDVLSDDMADRPDMAAAYVAASLPQITHPVLTRRIIDAYREWVVKHEGGSQQAQDNRITDPTLLALLKPYEGRWLLVDFWNMSCGPCRASMQDQRSMVERIAQTGIPASVVYVSDDAGKQRTNAKQWLQEQHIQGEQLFVSKDEWMQLRGALNFSAIPFCIIVGPDGTLIKSTDVHWTQFEELLQEKFPAYKAAKE